MRTLPIALTIAGSDSGGGAGIQADLKTFAALGVHGASVITCVTAQNPARIAGVAAIDPDFVRLQLKAVFSEIPPAALKTGMLYSKEIIHTVDRFLRRLQHRPPMVIDPVMISTSGAALLKAEAIKALQQLFPGNLITPNVDEAQALLGERIASHEDLRAAARELRRRHQCAVLAKGGHLAGGKEAIDFFFDGNTELMLSSPRVSGVKTHGTGCTYAAAITTYLACGLTLENAVVAAKKYISGAIANSVRIGRKHHALGWFSA